MPYLLSFRRLLLWLLQCQLYIHYARAPWPLSSTSTIQLLGLFADPPNASKSDITVMSVYPQAMFKAAIVLSQRLNIIIEGQHIGWQIAKTGGNAIAALSSASGIMSTSNIVGIVGPAYSRETRVIATLAGSVGIPAISYAATDPELSNRYAYPAFHRTIPSDYATAYALAKLFLRYNWTSCIMIYQNDEFGSHGADAINDVFDINNLTVRETLMFDISTHSFRDDMKNVLSSSSTRIVILWADEIHTTTILQAALVNHVLGPQFLWILRSMASLTSFNQSFHSQLIGIITVEPAVGSTVNATVNTTLLNTAYDIWKEYEPETFPGSTQVDNSALFTFDATWTLIQSLWTLCSTGVTSLSTCLSVVNSPSCFNRRFLNADSFYHTIDTIEFLGVSGSIKFSHSTTDRIDGTYYIARNVQPFLNRLNYVPVLKYFNFSEWIDATQTNGMIWPGNSLLPPTGLPRLAGVSIRIAVFQTPPFTMVTNVTSATGENMTKVTGYVPDLIELLKQRMAFVPQIIVAPPDQTYDGMVQAIADNVYDIAIGDMTVTAERRRFVDFSHALSENSLRIIVRQTDSVDVDLFWYLKPFSIRLWLMILAVLLFAGVLIYILECRENESMEDKSVVSAFGMSLWYVFAIFQGYGADFHVHTAAGRLLSVGLYTMSLILMALYTANLASILTVQKTKNIISGIDDIKNGKLPFNRIGIVAGGALEDYYLREISRGSRNFYPLATQAEIYRRLLDNTIDAAIHDGSTLEYAVNRLYCNLTLVGSQFSPSVFEIAMRKHWPYAQTLDVTILSIKESGEIDDLKREWFEGRTCPDSSITNAAISLEAVGGLFIIFGIISALSLLFFVWLKRFAIKTYLLTLAQKKRVFMQHQNSG